MQCGKAEQGSGADLHRKEAYAGSRLARGAALLSVVCLLSLASGCVSSVDPVLGSAASTQSQAATSEIALNVAAAPDAAGVIDATGTPVSPSPPAPPSQQQAPIEAATTPPADEAVAAGEAAAATPAAAAEIASAMPVPLRAPREASPAGEPDAALAFAEPAATPLADATALATKPSDLSQTAAATPGMALSTSNAPVSAAEPATAAASTAGEASAKLKPVKKASLFEFLKQRQEQRDAALKAASAKPAAANGPEGATDTGQSARVASLEPQENARASQGGGKAVSALPGVQSGPELFGIAAEEEEEDVLEPFEVASAGSMARLSPKGILTQTDKVEVGCFGPELLSVLKRIEAHYRKPVVVTSGYRNPGANRRAGGARHSMHMQCKAADIQIKGVSKWNLAKYLRSVQGRGGVGTYCRTNSVHIDTGPERDWHYPCRRAKKKRA